ncbi:MAG: M14 family zinc carboxypeptidase [Aquabacterium sp.]|uniref:M14 family zinc carboxypeptidase n=1 Tax=Aquabacterium sp. TaxID=1872578 RepID=UPI002719F944|nr:M14 family zinc carboxypeptidase [Aquabacterium sp.]MDO9002926.1 M14 family zinc carboxypeptidase [Aquabacterium sp.]
MAKLFRLDRRSFVPSQTPHRLTGDEAPAALIELADLQRILDEAGPQVEVSQVCQVQAGPHHFPVQAITLGNPSKDVPAVGFFGGVHGLERIGSRVVMAYLRSLVMRLKWDAQLHRQLESIRLVFMPIVNPGGLWAGTRANPQGVDLMRNAPVNATEPVPFMLGGQRLSPALPWYRGPADAAMEVESQALCQVVEQELLSRRFSMAIDCHSGFGMVDRIWFPHAHTTQPIKHLPEMLALNQIFDQAYPHHRYVIEPQSRQYLTHGDLWDHLYLRACAQEGRTLLPLTLEMGSWLWIKKNPRQIFSRQGIFNPLAEHRQQRVLRRHMAWLDFITHAASSHASWVPQGPARDAHRQAAHERWYG